MLRGKALQHGPYRVVGEICERDGQDLVAEADGRATREDLPQAGALQTRDGEEQLPDAATPGQLREAGDGAEDGLAPDGAARLLGIVVDEPDHLVRVLVGAPEVAQEQLSRAS